MKRRLLLFFLLTAYLPGSSQQQGTTKPLEISKTRLTQATHISDLLPALPKSIYNFSANMLVRTYGKLNKSTASNSCGKLIPGQTNGDLLDEEQLQFLRTVDTGASIYISVKYTEQEGQEIKSLTAVIHVSGL